jgi:outer membrane lipoprotein-sorting protein
MKATSITPKRAAGLMAALLVILLGAIWSQAAFAYVLEGPHILDLTAKAMGKLPPLKIDQKLLIYPLMSDAFPTVLDETVIYVMPRRFRSDIVSEQINRTHLEVARQSLTVIDGRITTTADPFDLYQRLLRSRTRSQLMKTLGYLGVETAISSLGRVDETVVYVLGARYPDASVSQLAVDKETFLPLRLLLTDGESDDPGQRLEIYYHNWQKVQDGWYPAQVVFYMGGNLVREIRVVQIRANPSIPADLMDLEALKTSIAVTQTDTPQEQKQETVDAIRQGVQDFQKKFD